MNKTLEERTLHAKPTRVTHAITEGVLDATNPTSNHRKAKDFLTAALVWLNAGWLAVSVLAAAFAPDVIGAHISFFETWELQVLFAVGSFAFSRIYLELVKVNESTSTLHESMNQLKDEQRNQASGIVNLGGDHAHLCLLYDVRKGALYYGSPGDVNRNILINNETFRVLLETCIDFRDQVNLTEFGLKEKSPLYALGYACSKNFANKFANYHLSRDQRQRFNLTEWLEVWRDYDSKAGFGRIDLDPIENGVFSCRVVIKDSFLMHNHQGISSPCLCKFMEGYLEGLFKNLPAATYDKFDLDVDNIRVVHLKGDCVYFSGDHHKGCVFEVSVPPREPVI